MKKKLTILLICLTTLSFSQQVTDSTTTTLEEVRIEGVRAYANTPVPQVTIHKSEIQRFHQGFEVSQFLDDTPAVTSSSDGGHPYGYTSFRIRGIDQTRINMTLNGVPLNEPEDQGVYFSNYPNFLETISSFQVQRGVGTSTNGVSSYGGSINFIGNTGETRAVSAKITTGSFNTKLINASVGTGYGKRISGFLNFSSYETDGYKRGSGGTGTSFYFGGAYKGLKDIIRLTLFTGRSKNGMSWLPVSETDINNDPRTNYNENDGWDDFNQSFTQLEYNRQLNNKTKLTTTGYYTKLKGEYDYYMVGTNYFFLDSDFYGVNTNINKKYSTGEFNVGVNGSLYSREHKSTFEFDPFENVGRKNEANIYTKLNQNLGPFILFGDIQYRTVNFSYDGGIEMPVQQWNFFNPKGGFKIKANDGLEFYTFIAQTHREPTRSNLFGGSDNFVELSNIVAERVLDYEFGFNYKDQEVKFGFNFYHMNFTNEITSNGEYGDNSLLLFYNVAKSYRSGLEVSAIYKFKTGFGINYNGNFSTNGINGSDKVQLYSPDVIQNLSISYDKNGISSSISAKYHSTSYIDIQNEFTTPNFIVFNANVGYTYKAFSVYLSLINLTDQKYYTNGNAVGGERYFFVNAPLSYNATLKVKL